MAAHFMTASDQVDSTSMTSEQSDPLGIYGAQLKRVFDVLLVVVTLPFVLPVVAISALLVMTDGRNPFFLQKRVGRNGTVFTILKLRTMSSGAEALLEKHLARNPAARDEWKTKQKLTNDPRITWVGRWLRKSSIDELPQVFNVLLGQMSIVGPRPMMPSQRSLYPGTAYYRLRPGITGLWQISARNESDFAARADFDATYEAKLSLPGDLGIIARTVVVVLRGTGY